MLNGYIMAVNRLVLSSFYRSNLFNRDPITSHIGRSKDAEPRTAQNSEQQKRGTRQHSRHVLWVWDSFLCFAIIMRKESTLHSKPTVVIIWPRPLLNYGPRPLLIEDCRIMAGKNRVGGTWDPVLLRYEEPQRDPRESLLHKYNPLSRSFFWYLKL